jgi:protein TonB
MTGNGGLSSRTKREILPKLNPCSNCSFAGIILIRYYIRVRIGNISYPYFFSVSLALHLALVPLVGRKPFSASPAFDPIAVSFLPEVKPIEREKKLTAPPLRPQRRLGRSQARQLKPAAPLEKRLAPPAPQPAPRKVELPPPAEPTQRADPTVRPAAVEPPEAIEQASATPAPVPGEAAIFKDNKPERPITKSDLLPRRRDLIANHRAIPLNTADVRYAPYTQSVKQWIEARWEYPDLAKHYGLQGRVVVEFTILQNGYIEFVALVRSSGSKLLDEEAVRAIKAAVPFKPFPRSIQEPSLRIIAGFIYSDQRLRMTDTQ